MTQLTLTLDESVVRQAQKLANDAGKSVDEFISELVKTHSSLKDWERSLPPITRSLLGIAPPMSDEEVDNAIDEAMTERWNRK